MNKAQQIRKAPKFMVYIDTASDYKGKFKPTDKMIKKNCRRRNVSSILCRT